MGIEIPPPPPLPKYNIEDEAPKWDWTRYMYNLPVEREKKWTRTGTQPASDNDPDWRGVIRSKVHELPMPEEYKLGKPVHHHYYWFDTPDYADPFKKLWYATKFFSYVGMLSVTYVGAFRENVPLTVANFLNLTRRFYLPVMAAGLSASATVLVVANLRGQKDDIKNYIPAGLAAGLIYSKGCHITFVRRSVLCVAAAMAAKHTAEINGYLYPIYPFNKSMMSANAQGAEDGWMSGDFRFGLKFHNEDPGRSLRKVF